MRVERRKPTFQDARGVITDVLDGVRVECVTVLSTRKGAVRGNHYHKKTTQYLYVLAGRFRVFEQHAGGPVERRLLKAGDLLITPPRVRHAILALEDGTLVACAHGPRVGKDYENDTYRLDVPLVARQG
jgi:quercetin dioxygenase-like cupin family protein